MASNTTIQAGRDVPSDGAREFLAQEYQSLYTLHQSAKDVGDTRLNFYVTFAAAVGSILIAAQQFIRPDIYRWMLLGGITIIMCLGLITFRKMLQRRTAIIIYRRRLRRIRLWFAKYYPEIIPALPYEIDRDSPMHWGHNKLGSTAFSVAFINTALIFVLALALSVDIFGVVELWWSFPGSLVLCVLIWRLHLIWANRWMQAADQQDLKNIAHMDAINPYSTQFVSETGVEAHKSDVNPHTT